MSRERYNAGLVKATKTYSKDGILHTKLIDKITGKTSEIDAFEFWEIKSRTPANSRSLEVGDRGANKSYYQKWITQKNDLDELVEYINGNYVNLSFRSAQGYWVEVHRKTDDILLWFGDAVIESLTPTQLKDLLWDSRYYLNRGAYRIS